MSLADQLERARGMLEGWHYHYLGLFLVILAEEAGIPLPVPGDVFIATMGFLAAGGPAQGLWVAFAYTALAVTGATVIGASILYLLSRHLGRRLLAWAGRWLGYDEARAARMEAWLGRNGFLAVVVGRLIPGLRIVMTLVAGALRLPQATFSVGTLVAGLVWSSIYFWLGWGIGAASGPLLKHVAVPAWLVVALAVGAGAGVVLALRLRRARRRVRGASSADPR